MAGRIERGKRGRAEETRRAEGGARGVRESIDLYGADGVSERASEKEREKSCV